MDIGVWMSSDVLEHKLEARYDPNKETAWNVRSLPKGLGKPGEQDRLFVASAEKWRGFFLLKKEALWAPEDKAAPITLLFDAGSWTPVRTAPVRRFRGLRVLTQDQIEILNTKPNEIHMEGDTPFKKGSL